MKKTCRNVALFLDLTNVYVRIFNGSHMTTTEGELGAE